MFGCWPCQCVHSNRKLAEPPWPRALQGAVGLFSALDADEDGFLSYEEFEQWPSAFPPEPPEPEPKPEPDALAHKRAPKGHRHGSTKCHVADELPDEQKRLMSPPVAPPPVEHVEHIPRLPGRFEAMSGGWSDGSGWVFGMTVTILKQREVRQPK